MNMVSADCGTYFRSLCGCCRTQVYRSSTPAAASHTPAEASRGRPPVANMFRASGDASKDPVLFLQYAVVVMRNNGAVSLSICMPKHRHFKDRQLLCVCVCVLKRNSARSPVPATTRTQPQMGGSVDSVPTTWTSRVSSHMHVTSHRSKVGHPCHAPDASASRSRPQVHSDLPQDTN